MSNTVYVISGPTATGKTALGVRLAKATGGEVISADSMQIYPCIPILSAMPTEEEMQGVRHHLTGFADPTVPFTVVDWRSRALEVIHALLQEGKTPIVVGGTGLYIHALLYEPSFAAPPDEALREELQAQSTEELYRRLVLSAPQEAARLQQNDRRRISRTLEVLASGNSLCREDWQKPTPGLDFRLYCLTMERSMLYARINRRVDDMLVKGLAEEVLALRKRGIPPEAQCMQAIGCKQMNACFDGLCTPEEAAELIRRDSRRYAKRQITWLKKENPVWIDPTKEDPLAVILGEQT